MVVIRNSETQASEPRSADVFFGAFAGVCALFAIAIALHYADPLLRNADGLVFSLAPLLSGLSL